MCALTFGNIGLEILHDETVNRLQRRVMARLPQQGMKFQIAGQQTLVIDFRLGAQRLHFLETLAQPENFLLRGSFDDQTCHIPFKNQPQLLDFSKLRLRHNQFEKQRIKQGLIAATGHIGSITTSNFNDAQRRQNFHRLPHRPPAHRKQTGQLSFCWQSVTGQNAPLKQPLLDAGNNEINR